MAAYIKSNGYVIYITIFFSLLLSAIPFPDWLENFRPDWVLLVLIYWWLALPNRIGIFVGWVCGIFTDILTGTIIGQHALLFVLVGYLTIKLHLQIRLFSLAHQILFVFLLMIFNNMVMGWIRGFSGLPSTELNSWISPIISALFWPWIYLVLRNLRRSCQVM
jgi:rod shape-determining protein MreD